MDSEAYYVTTRSGNITALLSTQSLIMSQVVSWCGMRHESCGTVATNRSTVQPRITEYRTLVE